MKFYNVYFKLKNIRTTLKYTFPLTKQVGVKVMFQTCTQEVLDLNLSWDISYPH
jgi:hypothetical protein